MFFSEIPGRTIYTRKLDHNNPITPSAQNNKISQQFEDFFDPNYPILQRKGARMMTLIKREKVYCHEKLDSEGDSGEIGKVPCQLNNEDRILSVDWIWNYECLPFIITSSARYTAIQILSFFLADAVHLDKEKSKSLILACLSIGIKFDLDSLSPLFALDLERFSRGSRVTGAEIVSSEILLLSSPVIQYKIMCNPFDWLNELTLNLPLFKMFQEEKPEVWNQLIQLFHELIPFVTYDQSFLLFPSCLICGACLVLAARDISDEFFDENLSSDDDDSVSSKSASKMKITFLESSKHLVVSNESLNIVMISSAVSSLTPSSPRAIHSSSILQNSDPNGPESDSILKHSSQTSASSPSSSSDSSRQRIASDNKMEFEKVIEVTLQETFSYGGALEYCINFILKLKAIAETI